MWSRASHELSEAENIIVIGYSLPETDSFFRYLYALGSESNARVRNFILVNPDSSGSVHSRFKNLIGRGIENRFKHIKMDFNDSILEIENVLKNP